MKATPHPHGGGGRRRGGGGARRGILGGAGSPVRGEGSTNGVGGGKLEDRGGPPAFLGHSNVAVSSRHRVCVRSGLGLGPAEGLGPDTTYPTRHISP